MRNERKAKMPAVKLTKDTMLDIWSGFADGVMPNSLWKLFSCVIDAVLPSSQPFV